jgi:hypothetical protein
MGLIITHTGYILDYVALTSATCSSAPPAV